MVGRRRPEYVPQALLSWSYRQSCPPMKSGTPGFALGVARTGRKGDAKVVAMDFTNDSMIGGILRRRRKVDFNG